jgi:hypothetical protein
MQNTAASERHNDKPFNDLIPVQNPVEVKVCKYKTKNTPST